MTHFIEGLDRQQTMLLPEHLDDYVDEKSHVRAIDAFADVLDLAAPGFNAQAAATGRPGYHPGLMLRIYIYGVIILAVPTLICYKHSKQREYSPCLSYPAQNFTTKLKHMNM